ncbi:hypothetical protein CMEL01_14349 [Colletotrichum melonis]|uniref:Heterokaryon incompatibility domain-containing protein n=1 Tax=Colletotrichum melonis TaxID=1209925 RepID=A0AAI9UQR1_9PEZI|nr:hypothetical protein CMEL01_14349 [Colletotrichum melonis]
MPLQNDMKGPSGPFELSHLLQLTGVVSLSNFRIERREAEIWAMRDCKFLIFDPDSEPIDNRMGKSKYDASEPDSAGKLDLTTTSCILADDDDGQDAEPQSSGKSKGKEVAREGFHITESRTDATFHIMSSLGPNYGPLLCGNPAHTTEADCGREPEASCSICSKCPEFPHDRKTSNFRLFRPRDKFPELFKDDVPAADNICAHYLAVSYCWPPKQVDHKGQVVDIPRSYKVRDLDGTVRDNRALDDVLDRAVDAANKFGVRMIWIDQECLPQPPDDDKPPGREEKELGIQAMDIIYNRALITAGLQDVEISNQLQLETLLGVASQSKPIRSYRDLDIIIEFLDKVKNDRWYTRAWVIQEAISAGDNLCLAFRRGPQVSDKSKTRMPTVRRGLPKHSLESEPRHLPSDVIFLMVEEFRRIVQAAKMFLQRTAFAAAPWGPNIYTDGRLRPREQAVAVAETLHPVFWKPEHHNFRFGVVGATMFGIRPTVDAAGALTLLKTRECYQDEDRIVIMANMCGYEFRFSPKLIAEHCISLRVALLALSILNCDFSLLVPEAYADASVVNDLDEPNLRLLQTYRPGWVHPFDIDHHFLQQVTIRGFNIPQTQTRDTRFGVIRIPAYLWEVSYEPIDLTPIKFRWKEEWMLMMCLSTKFVRQKDEDEEAYRVRKKAINERQDRPGAYTFLKRELGENGVISNDSPFWSGIESYAGTVEFKLVLLAERLKNFPKYQTIFSQIFFDILKLLLSQADADSRALGVANSIWQSMRVDLVSPDQPELPDIVCESLFQHPAVQNTPFKTIKLDKARDEEHHQMWLFHRIMTHGSLYIARYVPEPKVDTAGMPHPTIKGARVENNEISEIAGWEYLAESFGVKPAVEESLMERQQRLIMQSHVFSAANIQDYFETEDDTKRKDRIRTFGTHLTPGVLTATTDKIARALAGDTEDRRAKKLFSVFDVDGPCTVATPHGPSWEMIPHPPLRSMSTCWVVEVSRPTANDTRLTLEGSNPSSSNVHKSNNDELPSMSIRVLDKVKGVWPIMQVIPREKYTVIDTRDVVPT